MILACIAATALIQGEATKITLFGQKSYYQQPAKEKKVKTTTTAKVVRTNSERKRTDRVVKRTEEKKAKEEVFVKKATAIKVDKKKELRDLTVAFEFVREDGQPVQIDGVSYSANQRNGAAPVTNGGELKLDVTGKATIGKLKALPGALTLRLSDELVADQSGSSASTAEWEPTNDLDLAVELPLSYKEKNATKPISITKKVVLRRQVADFEIVGLPEDARIDFGDMSVPIRRNADKAIFQIDRDSLSSGAEVLLTTGKPAPKQAVLKLPADANPYSTNTLQFDPSKWELEGLPNVSILGLSDVGGYFDKVKRDYRPRSAGDEWPFTVESYLRPSAFGLAAAEGAPNADGSKTVQRKGVHFKVRQIRANTIRGQENISIVERVDIEDAEGGSIGGLKVGDPTTRIVEVLGKPDGVEGSTRTYLNGMIFESAGSQISKISITAPIPLLTEGYVPKAVKIPNRLYVESRSEVRLTGLNQQNDNSQASVFDLLGKVFGRSVEQELADLDRLMTAKLKNIGGFGQVERSADSDLIVRWNLTDIDLDRNRHTAKLEGFLRILEPGTGSGSDTIVISRQITGAGEGQASLIGGENPDAMALRRAREDMYAKVLDALRQALDVRVRVAEIQNEMIVLDAGEDQGIQPGYEFEIENFGEAAWETKQGVPFRHRSGNEVLAVVARAVKVLGNRTYCEVGLLLRAKGEVGQGSHEEAGQTDPAKRKEMFTELSKWIADAKTGTVTAKFRVRNAPPIKT